MSKVIFEIWEFKKFILLNILLRTDACACIQLVWGGEDSEAGREESAEVIEFDQPQLIAQPCCILPQISFD